MRHIACFVVAIISSHLCVAYGETDAVQPNIIVVMADDHAQWAVGAYGLDQIETPNLDWLADQGVLFKNAMSPAPVCSPARASFYTGKMPSQHGVHDYLEADREYDAGWLEGEVLLSERLQDEGYRTGLFGKWHATTDSRLPQPGFDRWLSHDVVDAGWQNQFVHSGTVQFSRGGNVFRHADVQARFLTDEAIRFVDEPSDKPFFISLNFVEPHAPFEGMPERLVSKYRGIAGEIVRNGDTSDLPNRNPRAATPPDHVERLAQYLAAVSLIDHQVGTLLDALDGRDLLRNTIVIYTSDHGLLVGQYGLYGKTNASRPVNFYEETIRIPLIVYGPDDLLQPSQSRHELVDILDLHATVIDYASQGRVTESDYGPGRSIRALLLGERNSNWRTVQFAERGNARMISDGRWKLVRYYQQDSDLAPEDLWYDLVHPFGERHVSTPPQDRLRDSLASQLENFFEEYETPEHSGRFIWEQPPPNARTYQERLRELNGN